MELYSDNKIYQLYLRDRFFMALTTISNKRDSIFLERNIRWIICWHMNEKERIVIVIIKLVNKRSLSIMRLGNDWYFQSLARNGLLSLVWFNFHLELELVRREGPCRAHPCRGEGRYCRDDILIIYFRLTKNHESCSNVNKLYQFVKLNTSQISTGLLLSLPPSQLIRGAADKEDCQDNERKDK